MTTEFNLDWDHISWNECKKRISQIKENNLIKSIEVRLSPISGFHIYLKLYHNLHIEHIWRLRRAWKDDGNRLVRDVFSTLSHRNVMFRYKKIGGQTWYEVPIYIYTRIEYKKAEWTIKHLRPEPSIMTGISNYE